MQEVLKKYPYNTKNYSKNFITIRALKEIHKFAKNHPEIEKIYAKGSIIYGTLVKGSDIDHLRIKLNKPLNLDKKIKLVEELETKLKKYQITKLQRIKENNYLRVFYDNIELINYPLALTIKDEIYPNIHLITAKNKKEYLKKVYKRAYKYNSFVDQKWLNKYKERFKLL